MSRIIRLIKERTFLSKGYRKVFKIFLCPVFSHIFNFCRIKDKKIVIDNFGGKGYGDNPKYIAEELLSRKKRCDIVWLVDNLSTDSFPDGIRRVKMDTVRGLYDRATARIWIDNIRNLHPVKKKKNQIYLQTWHAPFSPKKLEGDATRLLGNEYIREAKYDGSITNAILANSKLQEEQYLRAFWLSKNTEILRVGLPRNDYLAKAANNEKLCIHVREKLHFDGEDVYILYAPTFRDDYSMEGYAIDFDRIINCFECLTKRRCHVVVRLHPNVTDQAQLISYNFKVLNGTSYPDIQELSIACDYVISDYSTSLFDFALLNKPAFICALDLEQYKKMRGLLPEYDTFPFPTAKTNEELAKNIINFDRKKYDKEVMDYFEKYPVYDKGNAAEKTVDWLIKYLL